jgi:hypothetical protein
MVLSVVALIIQLLPGILSSTGLISGSLSTLISQLAAAIPGLIASIVTKQPAPTEIATILAAIQDELTVLKASTTLNPVALADATTLDAALTNALAAYQTAGTVDDPSTLTPLPTNL